MEREDATDEAVERPAALAKLNDSLKREGFEGFYGSDVYGSDQKCHLRHIATNSSASMFSVSPHRPFTTAEIEKRERLDKYLKSVSEDEFIEEVLLPLFRQLGFQRITASGSKVRGDGPRSSGPLSARPSLRQPSPCVRRRAGRGPKPPLSPIRRTSSGEVGFSCPPWTARGRRGDDMPGIVVGVDGLGDSHQALEWAIKHAALEHVP